MFSTGKLKPELPDGYQIPFSERYVSSAAYKALLVL